MLNRLKSDDMARHSLLMVFFGLLGGFFNYLYQLTMGRLLTPAQYGTLFSLLSFFMIVTVFSSSFQTSTAKFTSRFKAQDSLGKVNYLWKFSVKRTLLLGAVLFLILVAFSPFISRFLNIDNHWYCVILFSSFILLFAVPVNQGILQGLQRFLALGFCMALLSFLKFSLGILLVYLGLELSGALLPLFVGSVMVFAATLFFLRNIVRLQNEECELSGLSSYTSLALVAIFSFAVLTNADVILAKHYLSPESAGTYSAISVLGRIAFYAPAGVALALFPKTSELFETGKSHYPLLLKAVLYTVLLGGGIVIIYGLFGGPIADLVFGGKYLLTMLNLLKYGLAMLFFALSLVLMNYLLSLNRTKVAYSLIAAMFLQLGLIAFFHSSIAQIVNIMLISSGILCVCLTAFIGLKWGDAARAK